MADVFYVPIFFILFRECLETSIIVAVLLALLKKTLGPENDQVLYKKLRKQVWLGVGLGLVICFIVGCAMIGAFYGLGRETFSKSEYLWEGIFALIASIIISIMGAAILRVSKLQEKWSIKLTKALEARKGTGTETKRGFKQWAEKYAMFILPFITVLREGLEAVVFAGGVGLGQPASAIPLPVITGLLAGALVGYILYRTGTSSALQIFLVASTCFLYLVAAGLLSKGVRSLETNTWNKLVGGDAAEAGDGPGSYDIRQSVWHINCCSPDIGGGGGWGVFNSLFGWTNSATYGSVISYNLYWVVIIVTFAAMRYKEQKGHWPLLSKTKQYPKKQSSSNNFVSGAKSHEKGTVKSIESEEISTNVREITSP